MIEYRKGNLLDVKEGVIAHGVNCQGVMGAGVALAIKNAYPNVYDHYYSKCRADMQYDDCEILGDVQFVTVTEKPLLVITNCFTQESCGQDKRHVNYEAVAKCFWILNSRVKLYTYGPLYIPKIGAGLAGGDWKVISAIIESEYKGEVVCLEL